MGVNVCKFRPPPSFDKIYKFHLSFEQSTTKPQSSTVRHRRQPSTSFVANFRLSTWSSHRLNWPNWPNWSLAVLVDNTRYLTARIFGGIVTFCEKFRHAGLCVCANSATNVTCYEHLLKLMLLQALNINQEKRNKPKRLLTTSRNASWEMLLLLKQQRLL